MPQAPDFASVAHFKVFWSEATSRSSGGGIASAVGAGGAAGGAAALGAADPPEEGGSQAGSRSAGSRSARAERGMGREHRTRQRQIAAATARRRLVRGGAATARGGYAPVGGQCFQA